MKCICGYEKNIIDNIGDDNFIRIRGNFFVDRYSCEFASGEKRINLYACPKCETIRMEE